MNPNQQTEDNHGHGGGPAMGRKSEARKPEVRATATAAHQMLLVISFSLENDESRRWISARTAGDDHASCDVRDDVILDTMRRAHGMAASARTA